MNLSDALPIRFFYNGEPTFNEMEDDDVIEKFCFFQEFECDDVITLQLTDDTNSSFNLLIQDEEDEELAKIPYIKNGDVHNISFSGASVLACEKMVRLFITKITDIPTSIFTFNTDQSGFFNTTNGTTETTIGPRANWANIDGESIQVITAETYGIKDFARYGFNIPGVGSRIKIRWKISESPSSPGLRLRILLYDEDNNILLNQQFTSSFLIDGQYHTYEYTVLDSALIQTSRIRIVGATTGDIWVAGDVIKIDNIEITELSAEEVQARTDLVRFSNEIDNNVKMTYTGNKNFAGLNYSTPITFMTRVPGIFFHPRKKSTSTALELSNSRFITTSTMLQKKRLLQVQDCPEYMHDMIELILNHAAIGSVVINNVEWERDSGDDYVLDQDRPDSYPLYPAEVVLSRRNYVKRNVI